MTHGLVMSRGNGLRPPEQHDALSPHDASLTRMPQMSKSRKQQRHEVYSEHSEPYYQPINEEALPSWKAYEK